MQENRKQGHEHDLIIVGSGRSLQGSNFGETIDFFGRVFRFKGYENGIGKHDEDVGTKCTDLFFNCNQYVLQDVAKKIDEGTLSASIQTFHFGYHRRLKYLDEFLSIQHLCETKGHKLSYMPCHDYTIELRNFFPLWELAKWMRASSGLHVIYHFLRVQSILGHDNDDDCSKIYIAGFDSLVPNNVKIIKGRLFSHYYEITEVEKASKRPLIPYHNLKAESKLLKRWLAEGKIHLLRESAQAD
ncbi:MAG: glycosyltransferase family 29 protein [Caldilineaceae bacterium]